MAKSKKKPSPKPKSKARNKAKAKAQTKPKAPAAEGLDGALVARIAAALERLAPRAVPPVDFAAADA
ncbi:MAG: AAA family ATPase, partial [Pseudolabrys sp.]